MVKKKIRNIRKLTEKDRGHKTLTNSIFLLATTKGTNKTQLWILINLLNVKGLKKKNVEITKKVIFTEGKKKTSLKVIFLWESQYKPLYWYKQIAKKAGFLSGV